MTKKIKDPNRPKPNAWKIIEAILAALGSLLSSLKRSHDSAKAASNSAEAEQEKLEPTTPSD